MTEMNIQLLVLKDNSNYILHRVSVKCKLLNRHDDEKKRSVMLKFAIPYIAACNSAKLSRKE